ncbi:methylenetetrahydrofolate reductase [NAD(P)H] [Terracoccus luteus]|jgi:methylenetetrahydrofolate reductase (NADPH)|uniref:Methylenetetrahydrofolate reductase n=1 Tax=Terracoccus luteus TaxID=53356 RepID=A0A839PSF9_9MICO|nr:methylenetetrahydrofolate reductase [NAD(P)H] [Terracoccus luteus]MBB2984926.1 methylenetetrahydrofolate reductase (NADPH) [Terracoccus luteus]MCP2170578.1 methylenetetrahydrofolate reductase (NADPH) [Terracoccus luteus]
MAHGTASSMVRAERFTRSIPEMVQADASTFSFEFFPPKDDAAATTLWEAIRRLEKLSPSFVSITYGAGGTTRDRTVRLTQRVLESTSLTPLAHLTCVGHSRDELRRVVGQYAAAGVHNILALRGDPQGGLGEPWTPHPEGFDHADELVAFIRSLGDFTVGVAAFPDGHPESRGVADDAEALVRKERAGAGFAVTQMVFDVENYLRLRDEVARRGSSLPVIPAIMPITNARQVVRMAELAGQPMPTAVTDRLGRAGDDPAAVRAEGLAIATESSRRLLDEGAPGIHFITMNRSSATLEVFGNL